MDEQNSFGHHWFFDVVLVAIAVLATLGAVVYSFLLGAGLIAL